MKCIKCDNQQDIPHRMVYSRKSGYVSGYVCGQCNDMLEDPDTRYVRVAYGVNCVWKGEDQHKPKQPKLITS
jgi:hypothetical protein